MIRSGITVEVAATGAYLPGDPITNHQLEALVGPLPEEILAGIQVEQRHWILDDGEHRESNSDMAVKAVRQGLARAGATAADVDLLVVSTSSPDQLLPPMSTLVQAKLGLTRCAVLDIRSGCAGAVEALDIARLYIESGRFSTAVVVGTEAISPLLAPLLAQGAAGGLRVRDRMSLYTFGDGAGALVLRAAGDTDAEGLHPAAFACLGGDKDPGMHIVGGGTDEPIARQLSRRRPIELKVDLQASGRVTPHVIAAGLTEVLTAAGCNPMDVDVCILPEGNAGYLRDELESAGALTDDWVAVEDRVVENLARVGATGSAAVPLALDDAWCSGRLRPGQRVMMLAIETSRWKFAGAVACWSAAGPAPVAVETQHGATGAAWGTAR